MPKKTDKPLSFEASLTELEKIVHQLESGQLSLDDALNQFEQGIQLARQAQKQLQQAEQRVQILLSDSSEVPLSPFTDDDK